MNGITGFSEFYRWLPSLFHECASESRTMSIARSFADIGIRF
jgi:hypothetical protein